MNSPAQSGAVRDSMSRPIPEGSSADVPVFGFTGSRDGMAGERVETLRDVLSGLSGGKPFTFTHGSCVGSDEQAHAVARELGAWIIARPAFPIGHPMRADCDADVVMPVRPPMDRNADIVETSREMVAAPSGPEVQRSGTWATVRMARRAKRLIHYV